MNYFQIANIYTTCNITECTMNVCVLKICMILLKKKLQYMGSEVEIHTDLLQFYLNNNANNMQIDLYIDKE